VAQGLTDNGEWTALVVLGKALQSGVIGCEFAMRIAAAVQRLETHRPRYHSLYFIGGGGEARAALDCFQTRYAYRFVDLPVVTEEQSITTVENIGCLANMLGRGGPEQVDLLSSDYHIERLRAIHHHLPGQSLLCPLASRLGELVAVPYFFHLLGDARCQWLARLYCAADKLNFPRANLEGILAGKETRVLPWSLEALANVIDQLHRAESTWKGEPGIADVLAKAMAELAALQSELSFACEQQSLQALAGFKGRLDRVMTDLRFAIDPDRPATRADWLAIERRLGLDQC